MLVHTNFPNTVKRVYAFSLADFDRLDHLDTLRRLFTDPDALKPGLTAQMITEQAAERFALMADGLRAKLLSLLGRGQGEGC